MSISFQPISGPSPFEEFKTELLRKLCEGTRVTYEEIARGYAEAVVSTLLDQLVSDLLLEIGAK